ncbi:hypothetical protein [Streptomyces sp. KL116D]|uniref:hypothetical protein n=1 Tax=Streptomyces sp. KL116D TaxID=3045152 RepID=UPI0035566F91
MSDEEWEQFLRESEEGVQDAPKEPSARARMVTRRLREEPGPPEWRSHRPAAPRRRRIWPVLGVLAAVALVVVALDPGRVTGWFGAAARTPRRSPRSPRAPAGPPPAAAGTPTLDASRSEVARRTLGATAPPGSGCRRPGPPAG